MIIHLNETNNVMEFWCNTDDCTDNTNLMHTINTIFNERKPNSKCRPVIFRSGNHPVETCMSDLFRYNATPSL